MSPEEIVKVSWATALLIYFLNLTPFVSFLSYFYMCWSGSTNLLNTDPIRIRIHNTAFCTYNVQLLYRIIGSGKKKKTADLNRKDSDRIRISNPGRQFNKRPRGDIQRWQLAIRSLREGRGSSQASFRAESGGVQYGTGRISCSLCQLSCCSVCHKPLSRIYKYHHRPFITSLL